MTSNSADTSAGIDMSGIFAPFFWGFFVSIFLGGITIVQAYMYFPHPSDRMCVQVIAAIMLILDLISSALVAQSLYYYLITLDPSAYHVTSFAIYSVKRVGIFASTVIGVLTLFAVLTFDRNEDFAIFFGLAKGFGAVTDIMATLAMCTFLSNAKTGIRQTDNLIKSLIQYVVERGGVVTLIQTLLLITFYAAPTKLYWLAFHINVTKLYANTFFCMLNARKGLWEKHAANNRATAMVSSIVTNGIEFRSTRSEGISTSGRSYALTPIDDQKSYPDIIDMPTITKTVIVSTA
ncbi:hypothetical protein C8R41DRAFT_869575 [Lentinula lateritia]|uniref:DUF6534 domain-containing protein n=1 Tax=Lentinula lateritia TaxID=40482 RepID=A0ABQ8V797_9AGAR|nr:hypothetical protein C8R41DRAFT_869575 [Lentinula lateritia]